jgi:hypothetical protein
LRSNLLVDRRMTLQQWLNADRPGSRIASHRGTRETRNSRNAELAKLDGSAQHGPLQLSRYSLETDII